MDWQVSSLSRESAVSGDAFSVGEIVQSILYRDESGELGRADMRESERDQWECSGTVMGWWNQEVLDREPTESEANRARMRTTEGLFISLYPDPQDELEMDEGDAPEAEATGEAESADDEDLNALKYLLAIMLERKRILKPVTRAVEGQSQVLRHPKLERHFEVPWVDITGEKILKIQEQLSHLV